MRLLLLCTALCFPALPTHAQDTRVPVTVVSALDGHQVRLPADLNAPTVVVLGFSRKASEAIMQWERGVRGPLSAPPLRPTFVAAVIEEVPGFARGFVVRSMQKQIPARLHENFLLLTADEAAWKRVAGFETGAPDAAYVLLLDSKGAVVWKTHEAFTPAALERLLAGEHALESASTH